MITTPIFKLFGADTREQIPIAEYNTLLEQYPGILDLWVQYRAYLGLEKKREIAESNLVSAQDGQQQVTENTAKFLEIQNLISALGAALADPALTVEKQIAYLEAKLTWEEKAQALGIETMAPDIPALEAVADQAAAEVNAAKVAINETLESWGLEAVL